MIVFEIHDKAQKNRNLGYLFYYEHSKRFFTELSEETDEWSCPFIFAGHVKKGIYSIDSVWSGKFVNQRIIPADRQNLGAILKENGLKEYDELKLLLLSEGRCAQDEIYLVRTAEDDISDEIRSRRGRKTLDVMALEDYKALVFFKDGKSVTADIKRLCGNDRAYGNILCNKDIFQNVRVSPGGNGIEWGEERFLSAELVRKAGKPAALSHNDIVGFIKERLSDTAETANMINCSRQYVKQLVDQERLTPLRKGANFNLFLKSEIEAEI